MSRKESYSIHEAEINEKEFFLHDFVFTKYGNYPHWPSRIISINKEKTVNSDTFGIHFYGTNKCAIATNQNMFSYAKNKAEFGKKKNIKHFNAAMKEIEAEIGKFTMYAKFFVANKKSQNFSHYRQYDFVLSKTPGSQL